MTGYSRGDVILVNFVFTDESRAKRRPALIVSSDFYQSGRNEVIISAITSKTDRILPGDHQINDWDRAGLLFPSAATAIVRTIKYHMIDRKLGSLTDPDMEACERQLRLVFDLV